MCAFECRQGLNRLARLPLRQANFIQALQIQPELRRGAEEVSQAQGGVAGDGAAKAGPSTRTRALSARPRSG